MPTTLDVPGVEDRLAEIMAWLSRESLRPDDVLNDWSGRVRKHDYWEFTFNQVLNDDKGRARYLDEITGAEHQPGAASYNLRRMKVCRSLSFVVPPPGWRDEPGKAWSISHYLHRGEGMVDDV